MIVSYHHHQIFKQILLTINDFDLVTILISTSFRAIFLDEDLVTGVDIDTTTALHWISNYWIESPIKYFPI